MLRRVVARLRAKYSLGIPILVRLDAGFASPLLQNVAEELRVKYVVGLPSTKKLPEWANRVLPGHAQSKSTIGLKAPSLASRSLGFKLRRPRSSSSDLCEVIRGHYERGAMMLTSNRAVGEWYPLFRDELMASAAMDRQLHRAHVVQMDDHSYRNPPPAHKVSQDRPTRPGWTSLKRAGAAAFPKAFPQLCRTPDPRSSKLISPDAQDCRVDQFEPTWGGLCQPILDTRAEVRIGSGWQVEQGGVEMDQVRAAWPGSPLRSSPPRRGVRTRERCYPYRLGTPEGRVPRSRHRSRVASMASARSIGGDNPTLAPEQIPGEHAP